jgi:hypothetical protein
MNTRIILSLGLLWLLLLPKPLWGEADLLLQQATPTETPTLAPTAAILAPLEGQAVQGRIPVQAFTAIQGFQAAELFFGYAEDPTGTWFLIGQNSEPLAGSEIGTWDTSLITDGNYDLRLLILLQDGTQVETVVNGLRVRNYSPVETDTPTPVIPTDTPLPGEKPTSTMTPLPTITPTPTPLPTNPAEMTTDQIAGSLGKGALAALSAFVILGFVVLVKISRRRKKPFDDGSD